MKLSKEDRIVELLEELVRWTKVTSIPHVKELLESLPDVEKIGYQYSDGRSSRDVAKVAKVRYDTVVKWWRKWHTLGIVEPMQVQRGMRYRRSFSLEDFDIKVPQLQKEKTTPEENKSKEEKENERN